MRVQFVLRGSLLIVLLLALSSFVGAAAQMTTGNIEGVVADQSGAVLPNVDVIVKNTQTGVSRTVTTDDRGNFRVLSLPVGVYEVSAELSGFAPFRHTGVALTVGQTLTFNIGLIVRGATSEVSVTSDAPLIETSRTQISSTVDDRAVANLPVNGRNFIDFVLLTPGVTRDTRTGDISFAGQRGTLNSLVVDGADNNNTFFGQTTGRTGSGRAPFQFSQDAVKEFQVNSNGYSAEYGRAAGAVINVVTKSGTNEFHGSVFEFYRDKSLNANDVINKIQGRPKSPYHFNQFGGSVGGPIKRDQSFFFFSYDGQRSKIPNLTFLNLPATVPTDPATQSAIQTLTPLAQSWTRALDQDTYLGKSDFQFGTVHRLSVRYNQQNFTGQGFENGGSQQSIEHSGNSLVKTNTIGGTLTSIVSNRLINEARAQFLRDKEPGTANSNKPEATILQGGQTVLIIGRNFFSPRETTIKRGQFADSISYIAGAHNMKFGADWNVDRILNYFPGNFSGAYTFASLASFAGGRPTGTGERYVQAFAGSGTTGATTTPNLSEFAGFFQDDYRASTNLTLNFGLRYDVQGIEQPTTRNPDPQLTAAGIDTSKIPTDKNNWAPRFGFAYKPLGGDRLVVRGGYGLFFGRTPSIMIGTAHSNNGLNVQTITVTGNAVPTYPNTLDSVPVGASAPAPTIFYFPNDYVSPYTEQGNFSVEYGLSNNLSVSATYLGVRGVHLQRSRDTNVVGLAPATITIANEGTVLSYQRVTGRLFSNIARSIAFESTANSIYHGLTLELNKRYSRHFQERVAYSWSKAIDDLPDATAVVPQGSDDAKYVQNPLNIRDDRGLSGNDIRHRLVVSGVWDLGYTSDSSNAVMRAVLGGWSTSYILTVQSGQPYTPTIGLTDLNNDGNNRNDRVPGLGRNTYHLPATWTLDPRISRDVKLREKAKLQFIAEGFNIFNRFNPLISSAATTVRTQLFAVTGGQLVRQSNFATVSGPANPRVVQLAAKIIF
jgi:Carboxypeptidase regulatory-like domain